ncbi:MAG: ABC transporter ATP-binding protein [Ignavibacteriales bacterium]|nr:ABC transporter ATP-binding protein [Ignavibacteriales bacterium]
MLILDHVVKKFGSYAAVNDLSLIIPSGEFFGFLGPNGAGKTTTIKMMTGLFTPTSGSISINGHNVLTDPIRAKSSFGYIPDQPFLYDKLTGREFLYYIGGLFKIPKAPLTETIDALVDKFEIGSWVNKRAEDYSQGMRQRITIAAAFVHNPATIIIDEPMVGLDPRSARLTKDALKQKSKEGVSIFMSTHSLEIVDELCDRVGIIKDGSLIYLDTRDNLHSVKAQYDGKLESVFLELTR